jgi:hypothetical protein
MPRRGLAAVAARVQFVRAVAEGGDLGAVLAQPRLDLELDLRERRRAHQSARDAALV